MGPSEGGVQNEYPRGHSTIVRPGAAGEGSREVKALLRDWPYVML